MYSKATVLGHPVHPILVVFPILLYAGTLCAYGAYAASGNAFWFHVGVGLNVAGVAGAFIAAVPGLIDWRKGIPRGHPAKAIGLEHMMLNLGALAFFAIDAVVQYGHRDELVPAWGAAVALAAVGMGLTVGAAILGSRMVNKLHVGDDLTVDPPEHPSHPARY